jgi:hypothetical protein
LTEEKDELLEQKERIGGLLREYFLDYEGHTKSSSLRHQVDLLELHISKLKDKEMKTKIKTRSRSRSKSNKITSIRCPERRSSLRGGNQSHH